MLCNLVGDLCNAGAIGRGTTAYNTELSPHSDLETLVGEHGGDKPLGFRVVGKAKCCVRSGDAVELARVLSGENGDCTVRHEGGIVSPWLVGWTT